MEKVLKPPESEIENTEVSESHNNGQRDLSLTDSSLTESAYSPSSALENQVLQRLTSSANQEASISGILPHTNRENEQAGEQSKQLFKHPADLQNRSSKEEKQRQNEEIVTLESSSLSSETGSWESVFPVRLAEKQKDACTAFINNERSSGSGESSAPVLNRKPAVVNLSNDPDAVLVQRSPFKSTSCFIDAASLVDDDDVIQVQSDDVTLVGADVLPAPSQPLACTTAKNDLSPLDWSESYDNDDSLEQLDKKDPDSLKKDMSPTIFDMTPVTEDSLGGTFEEAAQKEDAKQNEERDKEKKESFPVTYEYKHITPGYTRIMTSTPHNSLGAPKIKTLEVEDCDSDSTVVSGEGSSSHYFDYSSGGTTKDDHVSQPSSQPGSLLSRKKMQNIPIVSSAYNPTTNVFKTSPPKPKVSNASAWVVDMSSIEDDSKPAVPENRRPGDRMCETLKSEEKQRNHDSGCSRSSVDSDSSERSSHKFYIDLSSLPDHSPPKIDNSKSLNEKKNIFSMYIDLGEQPPVKEMPARLSSSLNAKRNAQSAKTSPRPKAKTNSSLKTNKNDVGVSSSSTPSRSVKKTADTRLATAEHESPKGFSLFEEYENLCANTEISISEIIGLPEKVTKLAPKKSPKSDVGIEKDETIQTKTLSAVTKQVQAKESSKEVFVRLSDLDKKRLYVESSDTIYEHCVSDIRMTRSIPDTNWADPSHHAVNSRSIEVISSFHSENTLSLNRLFPHLKNEFSRSMPSSLASRTRSPMRLSSSNGEVEEVISDLSELSSVQSSYHRSVVEKSTTDDSQTSSLIGNCQSRLGEDLLRMFLEEIAPDVIVEVSGKRFKAHKCILSSRCQYFAGILSGGWVESAGNVIVLPPFSYNVVHFALCHIYSGASRIPDSVSMVELATLADMLGLEGLKEAIMFTLKVKYCHNFHKPCQVCTAGVLECFPLSSVYGLDELYLKCLRWITKHFHKVWPTKAFATLPKELLDKCYQQHIVNMSTDTLVDTVCGCGLTEAALPSTRWAETVGRLCRRLLNAAAHYTAARLSSVVRLALQRAPPPAAAQTVDDCVAAAIEWAPPNEACRAYAFLSQMTKDLKNQQNPKPDLVTNGDFSAKGSLLWSLANHWRIRCEESIVRSAPRAIDTQAFKELPADLRKRLRDLGCIIYGSGLTASISPVPDKKRTKAQIRASSRSQDMEQVRANFVPYSPAPPVQGLNRPSQSRLRVSAVNAPKIRTTKAQEERARFNMAQTTHSQERRSKTNRYENTKPRYLEPLNKDKESDAKKLSANRLNVKMISSTESSRNSSPVLSRNVRASRIKGRPSQDSLASRPKTSEPSTEELSESQNSNKYATYTKTKHSTGSAESVKSYNHPRPPPLSLTQRGNGVRTKIPIYQNHFRNPDKTQPVPDKPTNKTQDRKVSASLMMATKSSSAKVVPKMDKKTTKQSNKHKGKTKNNVKLDEPNPAAIPVMDRSGTFLKDEPTFGDKTTNIDVAQ